MFIESLLQEAETCEQMADNVLGFMTMSPMWGDLITPELSFSDCPGSLKTEIA